MLASRCPTPKARNTTRRARRTVRSSIRKGEPPCPPFPPCRVHLLLLPSSLSLRGPSRLRPGSVPAPSRLRPGSVPAPSRLRPGSVPAPSRLRPCASGAQSSAHLRVHERAQRRQIEGFFQARVGDAIEELARLDGEGAAREKDDALGELRRLGRYVGKEFDARLHGHHQVADDGVEALAL